MSRHRIDDRRRERRVSVLGVVRTLTRRDHRTDLGPLRLRLIAGRRRDGYPIDTEMRMERALRAELAAT